ncbi:MAG: hypothetical protein RL186_303 [Pseudomonadota bacterium]|jgi:glycerophosphoryl diester phosphodiesterase
MTQILDRRVVLTGASALALTACANNSSNMTPRPQTAATPITPTKKVPIIIAHRGASGHRPEHTLESYRLAIEMGADFIEPDLVLTKDGHLVCRHENEIGGTTNVATKPEFAARKRVQMIDGERFEGWFTEDFNLAELKTLRCKERLPQLRPANQAFDDRFEIPTFEEVLALLKGRTTKLGAPLGIYPETKHPSHFERLGLSFDRALVRALTDAGLNDAAAPVFIQSFEVGNLKRLAGLTPVRKIQLVAADGGPADAPGVTYASMMQDGGLSTIATYAAGLGPEKAMLIPRDGSGNLLPASDLVARAHKAKLALHPWTFRAENYFLPKDFQAGNSSDSAFLAKHGDLAAEIKAFLDLGIDGLFSDHPDVAVAARDAWVLQHG